MNEIFSVEEKPQYYQRDISANGLKGYRWKNQFWLLVKQYLFKPSPHIASRWRVFLLKCFGAKIGKGCYIGSSVDITRPWLLVIGDRVAIDDGCWLSTPITIKNNASIAKCCMIMSGGHDVRARGFNHQAKPIIIGPSSFIGAGCYINAGVTIGQFACIGARSFVFKSVPENTIAFGNPCQVHSERISTEEYSKYKFD
ncbi:MAG: hypothetical protein IJK49_04720 [Prevotella sp.]|nr:hypothetical protein [Prevotella sp.]